MIKEGRVIKEGSDQGREGDDQGRKGDQGRKVIKEGR